MQFTVSIIIIIVIDIVPLLLYSMPVGHSSLNLNVVDVVFV